MQSILFTQLFCNQKIDTNENFDGSNVIVNPTKNCFCYDVKTNKYIKHNLHYDNFSSPIAKIKITTKTIDWNSVLVPCHVALWSYSCTLQLNYACVSDYSTIHICSLDLFEMYNLHHLKLQYLKTCGIKNGRETLLKWFWTSLWSVNSFNRKSVHISQVIYLFYFIF